MLAKTSHELFRAPNTIPPVTYVGKSVSKEGRAMGMMPHCHPFAIEVCYVTKGHLDWWTDSISFRLDPQDVLVVLDGHPHGAVDSAVQPCEYYWVHLGVKHLRPELAKPIVRPSFPGVHRCQPKIGELVVGIMNEHRKRDEFSEESVRALCDLLVVGLLRDYPLPNKKVPSELVKQAQEILQRTAVEDLSIEKVANRLQVSSVWLSKKFRQEIGESPAKWARSQRVAKAKRLLVLDQLTIGEIAIELGFSSSQYFSTVFRQETGLTPSEYRRSRVGLIEH